MTKIPFVGNAVADADLRFTPSGKAVANVTLAHTPRTFDKQSNGFVDGETVFMGVTAWGDMAENVAATIHKGMRCIVYGDVKANTFTDRNGNEQRRVEITADEIGPSLRWAQADVRRATNKGQGGGYAQGGGNGYSQANNAGGGQQGWGQSGGAWGQQNDPEPPF